MNKKILSALLLAAFTFASISMFVSCKDYDDDIKNLQTQIDTLSKTLSDIQTKIQNGAILESVTPITGGVRVVINGTPYDIKNGEDGADGADGTAWKIENGTWWKNEGNGWVDTTLKAVATDGSNGATPEIKEGYWYIDGRNTGVKAAGTDGATPEIKDGYWYINGVNTGVKAAGEDGSDGTSAGSGIYYVPNSETGKFDKYQNGKFVEATEISFLSNSDTPSNIITAVKDADVLTFYGVAGATGPNNSVAISLSGTLKSLVFIPHFYLDGIETIEYPWLGEYALVKETPEAPYTQTTHHQKTIKNTPTMYNFLPDRLSENPQDARQTKKLIYGPVIGVDYEINPSNASLTWDANQPSYKVLTPEVVYTNTRAAATSLKVTSPKTYGRYTEDKDVFEIKEAAATYKADKTLNSKVNNYLQAGLKVDRPDYLEPYPTNDLINGGFIPTTLDASYPANWYDMYIEDNTPYTDKDNTVALELRNIDNAEVTSDYALLIPSRVVLEGLIWQTSKHTESPMYKEPGFGPAAGGITGDEKGWYSMDDKIFIWDSPKEALDNANGAALELPVYDSYIDLKEYIGIRVLKENVITRKVAKNNWNACQYTANATDPEGVKKYYGDEESFGLHYEFELVDYETDTNVTHDSRYATFTDTSVDAAATGKVSKTGRVRALTVNEIQETDAASFGSTTAVDREPLVRILVKNNDGDVLLDGYILIHITNTKDNLNVTTYPVPPTKKFNFCDGVTYTTDWAQFSRLILEDAMGNYEKSTFDYFYWADCLDGGTVDAADAPFVTANALDLPAYDGHKTYSMKIFNFGSDIYGTSGAPAAKGNSNNKLETSNAFEDKALGVVRYYPNADGQTNHKFDWYLTADEVEYLTKGKAANEEVTVTRWIRFQAKTYQEANENMAAGTVPYTQDDYNAKYPYVWVKLTMKLTREALQAKYTKKIDNFWYNWSTGADTGWSGYLVDIEAPRDNKTIKDENWYGYISHTLFTNVPVLTNYTSGAALANAYQKGKYYFAPKTIEITGLSGRKYIITPQKSGKIGTNQADASATPSAADANWNKMYNTYVVKDQTFTKTPGTAGATAFTAKVKPTDSYTWAEATLKADMEKYSIDPRKGVFTSDILYAYDVTAKKYVQIAKIVEQQYTKGATTTENAGEIQLFHWLTAEDGLVGSATKTDFENWVCYDVLNAIGYKANNANINEELRSWLGFIGQQCEDKVAYYVEQDKDRYDDTNVATVLNSWKRPINLPNNNPDDALDAKTNENTVYIVDNLKMYDWRGDKPATDGYMYDNHYWFWGYYNIKGVAINLDGSKVQVDLNDGNGFVALNTVTSMLRLRPLTAGTVTTMPTTTTAYTLWGKLSGATYWEFPDLTAYNAEAKESQIEQVLGVNPVNKANKAQFGGFYYENDALTLTKFTLKFPIAIRYEWGWVYDATLTWKVDTTHGNN